MRKSLRNKLLFLVGFLIAIEIFLRFYFGFCDTVLMQEDPNYEYIAQPDQKRFRFRNHINYNTMSMRSDEVDSTAEKILGFGDSIINGGVQTDHDSLATTLLSKSLSRDWNRRVQFLNISAGSWGPDNCFAYLQKHGNFGGKEIFLFVSSHDAFDNMSFEKTVDANVSFPSKQYKLAMYELFDRYLLPRLQDKLPFLRSSPADDNLGINKKTAYTGFNPGFAQFANYAAKNKIPLTIYLHAEQSEVIAGRYNDQGQEIIKFANQNGLPLLKDLEFGINISDFRDPIHINAQGQRKMAAVVLAYLNKRRTLHLDSLLSEKIDE